MEIVWVFLFSDSPGRWSTNFEILTFYRYTSLIYIQHRCSGRDIYIFSFVCEHSGSIGFEILNFTSLDTTDMTMTEAILVGMSAALE